MRKTAKAKKSRQGNISVAVGRGSQATPTQIRVYCRLLGVAPKAVQREHHEHHGSGHFVHRGCFGVVHRTTDNNGEAQDSPKVRAFHTNTFLGSNQRRYQQGQSVFRRTEQTDIQLRFGSHSKNPLEFDPAHPSILAQVQCTENRNNVALQEIGINTTHY